MTRTPFTPALVLSVLLNWAHACNAQPAAGQQTVAGAAREVRVTTGPVIRSIADSSAVIAWSTNVTTDTLLRYGKSADNLDQLARAPWDGVTHSVQLRNLTPETTYYYRIGTSKVQNREPMSAVASFRTLARGQAQEGEWSSSVGPPRQP
jgi:phosphodiesterase/alkaline phosphatase D-like protein